MSAALPLLTAQQKALIEPLRHGSPVPVPRLVATLYAARFDGGPEDAEATVRTMIYYLRQRLARHGIAILTIGVGRGAQGYMLDPDHIGRLDALMGQAWAGALDVARARAHPVIDALLM